MGGGGAVGEGRGAVGEGGGAVGEGDRAVGEGDGAGRVVAEQVRGEAGEVLGRPVLEAFLVGGAPARLGGGEDAGAPASVGCSTWTR